MHVLIKRTYCEADEGEGEWHEERVARFDTRELAEAYEKAARNSPPTIGKFDRRFGTWTRHRKYRLESLLGGADSYRIEPEEDVPLNPTVPASPPEETVAFFTTAELTNKWERGGDWFHPVAVMADGSRVQGSGMCKKSVPELLNKQYGLTAPDGASA